MKRTETMCGNQTKVRKIIENQQFDEERALYASDHCKLRNCSFAGPADGESALKESYDIVIDRCRFSLRYPLWHVQGFQMNDSEMDEGTRAAIWYAGNGTITNSILNGIKVIRECSRIDLRNCRINSDEFAWKSSSLTVENTYIHSGYAFLDSSEVRIRNGKLDGQYACQYVNHLEIDNSDFNTKDAFWHSRNVTVRNSRIKGEYLGWFSDGLTLIDCRIEGTQPLCYCRNLVLQNCTMENADLAFEYSDVNADITGNIISVKNPRSGQIQADSVGAVIHDNPVMECTGNVVIRKREKNDVRSQKAEKENNDRERQIRHDPDR